MFACVYVSACVCLSVSLCLCLLCVCAGIYKPLINFTDAVEHLLGPAAKAADKSPLRTFFHDLIQQVFLEFIRDDLKTKIKLLNDTTDRPGDLKGQQAVLYHVRAQGGRKKSPMNQTMKRLKCHCRSFSSFPSCFPHAPFIPIFLSLCCCCCCW